MLEWARPLLETCSHSRAPQFPGSSPLFYRTNETDRKDWTLYPNCRFFHVFPDSHTQALSCHNYPSPSTRKAELVLIQPRLSSRIPNSLIFVSEDFKHFLASTWMNFTFALMILLQLHGSVIKTLAKKWRKFLCPKSDPLRTHTRLHSTIISLSFCIETLLILLTSPTSLFFSTDEAHFWKSIFNERHYGCYNPVLKGSESLKDLKVHAKAAPSTCEHMYTGGGRRCRLVQPPTSRITLSRHVLPGWPFWFLYKMASNIRILLCLLSPQTQLSPLNNITEKCPWLHI